MAKKSWYVIGLMSGTSLDGLDLVYAKFWLDRGYGFEILEKYSLNYSELWKNKLKGAFDVSAEELIQLDAEYGQFLGQQVKEFIEKKGVKKIDFIASHGHTVFHQPEAYFTLQIGNGAHIAAETGIKVIADFRGQDVALGGQGAPLVPIGDRHLFGSYGACLNIGGFANISYEVDQNRIAYDICAANIVLNHFTRAVGLEYDDGGQMASTGKVNQKLLGILNGLEFYQEKAPKSLGYEYVVDRILPIINDFEMTLEDILRTWVEHAAIQIGNVINKLGEKQGPGLKTLITGGGAFNHFLIERIGHQVKSELVIPGKDLINFKEALIFGFLGVLRDSEQVNCLKSVTGASKDHSSGLIYIV